MNNNYFVRFLKVAPLSLAIWRAIEAYQLSKMPIKYKKPILDIGCGFGEFAGVFFESKVEVGIDIDDKDLTRARQVKRYKKLVLADARNLPFKDNSFNTIISNSVLEHIPQVDKVIEESYRLLKPGGYLIYTVPLTSLYNNLYYTSLFEKLKAPYLSKFYFNIFNKIFKHVNMFNETRWIKLTESQGFHIITTTSMISKKATQMFDLTILLALPSQMTRWLLGKRFVVDIPGRIRLFNKLFGKLIYEDCKTGSNLLVVAQK